MSLAFSLGELARAAGGDLQGPDELVITGISSLDEGTPGSITFLEHARLAPKALDSGAAAFLVPAELNLERPVIRVANPRLAFARVMELFHPARPLVPGIHPTAALAPGVEVAAEAEVGPYCVLGQGSQVEAGVRLVAQVVLGAGCRIGAGSEIQPGVRLGAGCELGPGCRLDPGSLLQAGVRLGARVYLGARGLLGEGVAVGEGSKLDNLVLVGAGARLGRGSLLISQASVGAGAQLGDYCLVAGQSGIGPEVQLAAQVQVAGRSYVDHSFDQVGEALGGDPAGPLRLELKSRAERARALELVTWVRQRRSQCSISTS